MAVRPVGPRRGAAGGTAAADGQARQSRGSGVRQAPSPRAPGGQALSVREVICQRSVGFARAPAVRGRLWGTRTRPSLRLTGPGKDLLVNLGRKIRDLAPSKGSHVPCLCHPSRCHPSPERHRAPCTCGGPRRTPRAASHPGQHLRRRLAGSCPGQSRPAPRPRPWSPRGQAGTSSRSRDRPSSSEQGPGPKASKSRYYSKKVHKHSWRRETISSLSCPKIKNHRVMH